MGAEGIGTIRSVAGVAKITRGSGAVVRVEVGDAVGRRDIIETGKDGAVLVVLNDGTAIRLRGDACIKLAEFNYGGEDTSNSALIDVVKGKFAFVAGKLARAGRLEFDTPLARIRGSGSGFGVLTLAALLFSIRDVHAADPDVALLDDGVLTYKDLEHGVFVLETKGLNPRTIIVDNPGETVVLRPNGSSISVSAVANSREQMAELQSAYQGGFHTFVQGLQDPGIQHDVVPQSTNGATGSSTSPEPVALTSTALNLPESPSLSFRTENGANTTGPTTHSATTDDLPVVLKASNDGPVITSAAQSGAVTEDGTLTASGQVTASDADAGDHQAYAGNASGTYGNFAVDAATGVWTYTLNNGAANVQALAAGEAHDETFTVTVTDDHGASTTQAVTVTVNGSNDGPVITSAAQSGAVTEDGTLTASGQVTASDADAGDHQAYAGNASGTYGNFAVDAATGVWTYTLNNGAANVQALAAGEAHDETFTVTVTDDHGASTTQAVTVTVNGSNDGPVITSAAQSGAVTEDGTLTASGQVTASDADAGDHQAYAGNASGTYGSFAVDAATGVWTYTLNNGAANVQALAAGEAHDETFTVTVTDDHGASTTQAVTVTVNGSNDGPVITSAAQSGAVTEDGTLTASGQVTASDADAGDHQAYAGNASGTYGSFAVDAATGVWTYTLNNGAANVQALAAGEAHDETFTVTVTDDHGASTTQDVTVTVNGSNDGPVITSAAQSGAVTEDGTLTASGQVTASDADAGDHQAYAGNASGTYGNFAVDAATGVWTYTLNNGAANVQALAAGEAHDETFTVTVTDDHGASTTQAVTVTVNGSNDGPVITSAAQSGAVTEDGTLTASGQVTASDADAGDHQAYAGNASGTYGNFAVDAATGAWTYTLNNGAANVQALAAGEAHDETFTVTVTDDHGASTTQAVTVTVNGSNDGPVITSAAQSGAVTEDGTLTASGQVTASDADAGDHQAYAGNASGTYGNFAVDAATGVWTYTLNNGAANVQALAAGEAHDETFTVTVTDDHGASTTQDVIVTVNGSNDGPVITSAAQSGAVKKNGTLTASGQVTASDADAGDHQAYAGSASGTYGNFVVDAATGAWTYTLNNSAANVQALAAGEAHDETFTVTVTDDHGANATQDVIVTVNGNSSELHAPTSFAPSVTMDTVAPNAPTGLSYSNGYFSWDTGTDNPGGSGISYYLYEADTGNLSSPGGNFTATTSTGFSYDPVGNSTRTVFVEAVDVAGNVSGYSRLSIIAPAGIGGEAINLALAPVPFGAGEVSTTISGLPSGWSLGEGSDHGNGIWSLAADNLSTLTVTTEAGYVGAMLLKINETWTNADGSGGSALVLDNVEAYAPGSPIFALPGDDALTATKSSDLFVIAQPISNTIIYNFDAAADKIDLIGFADAANFSDLQHNIADDGHGNAVITVGDGETITLQGETVASLSAADFIFNQTPVMNNAGIMTIGDGAILPLTGAVNNTGMIELNSAGNGTTLQINQSGITLAGHGQVVLSDNAENAILGTGPGVTLHNVDNTISGAGHLGDGALTLVNEGVIDATGIAALVIDTGPDTIFNFGTIEATGRGGLVIHGDVSNSGLLRADGGNIAVHGSVTGTGLIEIGGQATLELGGPASQKVLFDTDASGTLVLDDAAHFSGTISGFAGTDAFSNAIDFKGLDLHSVTNWAFVPDAESTAGGTLYLLQDSDCAGCH